MGAGAHGTATGQHRNRLIAVLAVTLTVLTVEVIGGIVSGSLALLADAGHLLTDAAGISLALIAAAFATRPATPERTFGFQRAEILAALANALLLFAVAGFVIVEAIRRFSEPPTISSGLMLAVALVGLVANAGSLALLHRERGSSLNMRGAYLEVLGDFLGSGAVIVAAIVIWVTGWRQADPAASVLIACLILPRTWALLRDALDILLEATPKHVDLAEVRSHMACVPGVVDIHDLHAWTITSGVPVLSAHIVVADAAMTAGGGCDVLDRLGECLSGHFDVEHSTFQLESEGHRQHEPVQHT